MPEAKANSAAPERKIQQNPKTKMWEVIEFKKATDKWFVVAVKESKLQAESHLKLLQANAEKAVTAKVTV